MSMLRHLKSYLSRGSAPPPVALDTVPRETLLRSLAAGQALREVAASLAAEGRTVLDVVLNGNAFAKWQMYPWQGGILDQRCNSQYFYHSHEDYRGEHGHFHTFCYHRRKLVHLVALGMDERGRINRLYTFNRWGPGDTYFPADALKEMLPGFRIAPGNDLDARLHTFVTQALVLFRPEIEDLFDARDATFARYREAHNGASPYEDRSLEITSAVRVDLDTQLRRIAAALERRGASAAAAAAQAAAAASPDAAPATAPDAPAPPAPLPGASPAAGGAAPVGAEAQRPSAELRRRLEAGRAALAIAANLRERGRTVVELAMNAKAFEHWAMYPWDGGVIDKATRSQWFYHSHPESPEHGHFHTFYHHRNQLVHLVAVAMDDRGEPVSLFTVNRWVTDDFYLPAQRIAPLVSQFRIANDAFDRDVNAWLRNVLLLYKDEIVALLTERDAAFAHYRATHDGRAPFEDRDLDVTSAVDIRLEAKVEALEAELRRRGNG
jgi:hypothetical protein